MILWTMKLIGFVRRAIAGRKYPHQLAWAVAFGVLLGIVPHGNLLALGLLVLVLSLKINHAMATLVAIGASFAAVHLDPVSHEVGDFLLTEPKVAELASSAWALPMVPWTNLNNTVVVGSLTIGTVALLPIFLLTYPVFRFLAPEPDLEDQPKRKQANAQSADQATNPVVVMDRGHSVRPPKYRPSHQPAATTAIPAAPAMQDATEPMQRAAGQTTSAPTAADVPAQAQLVTPSPAASAEPKTPASNRIEFTEIHGPHESAAGPSQARVAVETRIDVIRFKETSTTETASGVPAKPGTAPDVETKPMDEALNYLLRQLRDSQEKDVA